MNLDNIFKAYDIRGLVPGELNPEIARLIGQAFGQFLGEDNTKLNGRSVVIGRDMRTDSEELAVATAEGLLAVGLNVIDIGRVTTDMVYFAVAHLKAAGGLVVTASHNAAGYNGIKLCRAGAEPVGIESGLKQVQALAEQGTRDTEHAKKDTPGSVISKDVTEAWVDHALSFIEISSLKPYHIAIDAGNGMAGVVIEYLAGKLPLGITPLYFEPDGSFPNHEANPMKVETLRDLGQTVRDKKLDFGIAFDGDGDRMGLVDEAGRPVDGSTVFALLAWAVLEKYPGAVIVHDVRLSRSARDFIKQQGGQPVRVRAGGPFIKAAMRTHGAPFGGETTGHLALAANYGIDSGLVAALLAVDMISRHDLRLSNFSDQLAGYVRIAEVNFKVNDKVTILEQVAAAFIDGEQDHLDGLTVNYDDWWFNLRPSNTEPLLRLNIEASTAEILESNLAQLRKLISDN